jgi:acyl-CoA synthetase (AMP-forming)/AMP-acid ligase II/acyl carrier protein
MEAAIERSYEAPGTSGIADLLRWRARYEGNRCAYSFLEQGDLQHLTYAELDARASELAARLVERDLRGRRAVLCIPTGEQFVISLFACMYASITAVPVFTPRRLADLTRIAAIAQDCQAAAVLTNGASAAAIQGLNWESLAMGKLPVLSVENLPTLGSRPTRVEPSWGNAPALLQYTSGSTGTPKGVVLHHANLLANLEAIQQAFGNDRAARGVIWLPPYHDMGLIGGILQPLYAGIPTLLLSPARFIKNPLAWLEAVQDYAATTSGGPNFAYDLCVRRASLEQRAKLDLSKWRVAFCGAEPVRSETLERFATTFEPCGFRRSAFLPCYGLAEATLMVSGGGQRRHLSANFDSAALAAHRAVPKSDGAEQATTLVSCGRPVMDTQVLIVDPVSKRPLPEGQVGEIWVSGPAVAAGYWGKPLESTETFAAFPAGDETPSYLRTGDLGFFFEGELYVTGRSKDLIVINGVNHYPSDIEATVQSISPALRRERGVAFSVPGGATEGLVVVQELDNHTNELTHTLGASLLGAIATAIIERHGVTPREVLLVARGTLSLTSSGKLQRQHTRTRYLLGELVSLVKPPRKDKRLDPAAVEDALRQHLSQMLSVPVSSIDTSATFAELGLDSVRAMEVAGQLEADFGVELEPAILYAHPTTRALAQWLSEAAR